MAAFHVWLLALMLWASPPERLAAVPTYPGWTETSETRRTRYDAIVDDALAVAFDPRVSGLYSGKTGRARTAAAVLAVAFHESGFAPDVDRGPCYLGVDGHLARCDGGRSACMMQVNVGTGTTLEGWTREDLFADRTKCFRAGLRLMRRSAKACRDNSEAERLAAYAGGVCDSTAAKAASRELVAFIQHWIDKMPIPRPAEPVTGGLPAALPDTGATSLAARAAP